MALQLGVELRLPVDVLVPTLSGVQGWRQRIEDRFQDDATRRLFEVHTYAKGAQPRDDALVVLDELGQLGGSWGRRLLDSLNSSHRVLGLTETPPWGTSAWDGFADLVGDRPVEVRPPALVRDGQLCPYQNLVWPVAMGPDDVGPLVELQGALDVARQHIGADVLKGWLTRQLHDHLDELVESMFVDQDTLLGAITRSLAAMDGPLPDRLPTDPTLFAAPSLFDQALVLWRAGQDSAAVRLQLAAAGYGVRNGRLTMQRDLIWQALCTSNARIRGCVDVLAIEHRVRGARLRALVATETRAMALAIAQRIVARDDLGGTDPLVLTSQAAIAPEAAWARIGPRLPEADWQQVDGGRAVEFTEWSSSARNEFFERLLEQRITQCLIATRDVLGEAWRSPTVQCVVDMTALTSSATHQLRSRGMTTDPRDPSKVANLWDVAVVAHGHPGGDRMLRRVVAHHDLTFGVDAVGHVVAGARRIDEALAEPGTAVADLQGIAERITVIAAEHEDVRIRWDVGEPYSDQHVWRVQPSADWDADRSIDSPTNPAHTFRPAAAYSPEPAMAGSLLIAAGVAGVLVPAALLLPQLWPLWVGIAAITMGIYAVHFRRWQIARGVWARRMDAWAASRPPGLSGVATALSGALQSVGLVTGTLKAEGTRLWLEGASQDSGAFAIAMHQLLGPIRYPRYLLLEECGRVWTVPACLADHKEHAEAFARLWAELVEPCELIFAREGRGRELLALAWQQVAHRRVRVEHLWE